MVVEFIDSVRDRFGVEPICRVLCEHGVPIAPSGYYAFKARARAGIVSPRAERDELLTEQIVRIFHDRQLGRGLAGARKMWRLLARQIAEGHVDAGLGPVARARSNG